MSALKIVPRPSAAAPFFSDNSLILSGASPKTLQKFEEDQIHDLRVEYSSGYRLLKYLFRYLHASFHRAVSVDDSRESGNKDIK